MQRSSPAAGRPRVLTAALSTLVAMASVMGGPVSGLVPPATAAATGSFGDPHFADFTVFSGLDHPTSVRFASDGRAFVTEKGGIVKAFSSISDTTPTTVIDISADVMNYWDRGLLGIAIDPDFLAGRPYLYLFYVYNHNAAPGGSPATWPDSCPNPPGGTTDGCPVTSHLDRITVDPATNLFVPGTRTNLLADWCQQFPSHSGGGLAFGHDGQLYLTGGDGASFNGMDYGQLGGTLPNPTSPVTPVNPCGDPVTVTSPPDSTPTVDPVSAQGGMLRAQDVRTSGDPLGLDGTLVRIDPDTGHGSAGNPLAAASDANAKRIAAHGFRNPYRLTFRPGTSDLYVADVGNSTWEEIEHVVLATGPRTATTLPNFGWPCYEGAAKQSAFDSLHTNLCTALYAQSGAVTMPLYTYSHKASLSPTGPCYTSVTGSQTSSVTGLAFYEGASGSAVPYPPKYDGALFFVDYSRNCLGAILAGSNGVPDATKVEMVASNIANPVDVVRGPDGDLYYVDHEGGRVARIRYRQSPVARATVTPTLRMAPADFHLDGSASTEPTADFTLDQWQWDLDHDGTFDGAGDASGEQVDWHVDTPGVYPVTLRVHSTSGLTDTVELTVDASNDPPEPVIDTPPASLTWSVGDPIPFTGHATDPQDGDPLPAADLTWTLVMEHCPAGCHEHTVETKTGVASGSFTAPDHEYPSHLQLRLTATDSDGAKTTVSVDLQPKTSTVGVASSPSGVPITIDSATHPASWTATVIRGSATTVSAPLTRRISDTRRRFSTWNDSHQRVRTFPALAPVNLTATYVPDAPDSCTSTTTLSPKRTWIAERSSGNSDVDWFEFHLAHRKRVTVSLAHPPIDLRLDLYRSCSTQLATSSHAGLAAESITRTLGPGTYRVRVKAPANGWSASTYAVRFLPGAP